MPKRSLPGGNNNRREKDTENAEQLNRAVDTLLSQADGKLAKVPDDLDPLLRVAADLRDLPREEFKTRLKSELLRGRKSMSTIAEPVVQTQTTATPRLAFRDAARAIEFYKNAFSAREIMRFEVGGEIPHAVIEIGGSTVLLTEEWPEGNRFSAETLGNSPVMMSVIVPDVDKFFAHAIEAGATTVLPIKNQFYGHREGTLQDPFGYKWAISTVIEQMPPEEMHRRMKGMETGPEGGRMPEGSSSVNPVPSGHRMVTPYLVVENGVALLDFAKQAFDAEEVVRAMTPTGVHGEVRIGDSLVMMGGGLGKEKFPATLHPSALHVYVEDADAVCRQAVAAGAALISEPRDQEYGERSGAVKDLAGNLWYIATAKGASYVPKGLHAVNPYLHPLRAEPLIGFLKRAFGAQEVAKHASPDGVVHHAEIRVGDSIVEMGEAQGQYQRMPAMFYLYVPDCDAAYKRALAAGAKSLHEPTDQPYGDRNSAVTDDFGNTWYIATHVRDV